MKKLIATLLALIMLLGCFAGCTQEKPEQTTEGKQNETVNQGGETKAPTEPEEITIKVLLCLTDAYKIAEIDDIEMIKKLDEMTGITTEWEIVRKSEWDTKLTLMMATGEYPDLIISRNGAVDIAEYGVDQGILAPVEDLTAKYMPNYTERLGELDYDATASLKGSDGHTYSIGYMSAENISTWTQWYINQDWLNALNLKAPTNVEGLTEVLRAFKTKDPNGNGQADEIPITFTMETGGTTNSTVCYLLPLFGIPFGGANSWLYVDDNKQVQFIPTADGFRDCMEWLHTLYEEELMDVEALSQDSTAIQRKLEDNVVGFVDLWRIANGTTYAETAGKSMALYTPGDGAKIYHYLELASPRVYITSTNEHPEKTAEWLNNYLEKENMYTMMNGRQNQEKDPTYSGWCYNEEGKVETLPAPKDMAFNDYLAGNGLFVAPGPWKAENIVISANAIEKTAANDVYEAAGIEQKYSNDYLKTAALNADDAEEKALIIADMDTAVKEWMAKFIMEGVSDESWYQFVGIMNEIGCDELVEMHQGLIDSQNLD